MASTWSEPGDVPVADWAKSVEVIREDEPLLVTPGGARRGLVAAQVRLPVLGAVRGPGCSSRYFLVGPLAYICADKVTVSGDPPGVDAGIHPMPRDGLPYRYYFAGASGADAFARLSDAEMDVVSQELERGWGVAGTLEFTHHGVTFVKTRRGKLIKRSQLASAGAFGFHGETLSKRAPEIPQLGLGWVMPERATVFAGKVPQPGRPGGPGKTPDIRTRLEKVDLLEAKTIGKELYYRIGDEAWLRAVDLRVPTPVSPTNMPVVGPFERWIDVDTTTQSLVAYEGLVPVFATLVSTGKPGTPTPKGTFKIWVKLRTATMSNADTTTDSGNAYRIEDVPWVQYFSNGIALHGAFWHKRFGFSHSHGCVNLAPLDAMKLFPFTAPRLPLGWDAVFPTAAESPTIVQVR